MAEETGTTELLEEIGLGTLEGFGTDTKIVNPRTLVVIVTDTPVPNKFSDDPNARQLLLQYRPVRFKLGGETGVWSEYFSPSTAKNSYMGALIEGCRAAGVKAKFARGDLVGKVVWIENKPMKFGKDADGSPREGSVRVPVAQATPEEVEEAKSLPPLGTEQVRLDEPAFEWTGETVGQAIEHVVGKTRKQVQMDAIKGRVPEAIRGPLANTSAFDYLLENGYVTEGADGKFQAN